jgi:hypothetical protein
VKKLGGILITLASIPFITFGLLFLIAASDNPNRPWVAVVTGAIGVFLLTAGLRRLRALAAISEDALRIGAVEMARRLGAELTIAQLRAEYRISQELAVKVLEGLAAEGACSREQRAERMVYVFKGLLPSLAKKQCPYCGTELPLRESLRKCPNCGAQLEITKT